MVVDIFWLVVGGGGYILAGGGWWWMVVGGGIVQSDLIDNIDNSNFLIKPLFNIHAVFQIVIEKDMFRSSRHRRCSVTKSVLRNFSKFTGKHLFQILFFKKVAGFRTATLLKNRLWQRCFLVNFEKFLRTPFVTEHLRPATLLKKRLWYRCFPVNFAKF